MKLLFYMFLILSSALWAQSASNTSKYSSGSTNLMGSGSKSVEGAGVNKDATKYKNLEHQNRQELLKLEIGNNPSSTDTIQGKNSKKIK